MLYRANSVEFVTQKLWDFDDWIVIVLQGLLALMLQEWAALFGPLILLLDDCHLFDTPSWLLLAQLAEAQVPLHFINIVMSNRW